MIRQIQISGLRGFASLETLDIAAPQERPGTGLTVLVGPNNGGKSTIIEALGALSKNRPQSFTVGKRNQAAGDRVTLTAIGVNDARRTLSQPLPKVEAKPFISQSPTWGKFYLCRLGASLIRDSVSPTFREKATFRVMIFFTQTRGSAIDQFAGRLFRIQQHRADFDKVFSSVVSQCRTGQ